VDRVHDERISLAGDRPPDTSVIPAAYQMGYLTYNAEMNLQNKDAHSGLGGLRYSKAFRLVAGHSRCKTTGEPAEKVGLVIFRSTWEPLGYCSKIQAVQNEHRIRSSADLQLSVALIPSPVLSDRHPRLREPLIKDCLAHRGNKSSRTLCSAVPLNFLTAFRNHKVREREHIHESNPFSLTN
jgi:hypothetical protein